MKVLICGSRGWTDAGAIRSRMAQLPSGTVLIVGGAPRGVDQIAEAIALSMGMTVEVFRAEWGKYGRRAGFVRNAVMLDQNPELVIAFWDGMSKGTSNTIMGAAARGIDLEVITK